MVDAARATARSRSKYNWVGTLKRRIADAEDDAALAGVSADLATPTLQLRST